MQQRHDPGDQPTVHTPWTGGPSRPTGSMWRWWLLAGSIAAVVAAVALLVVVVRSDRSTRSDTAAPSSTTTTALSSTTTTGPHVSTVTTAQKSSSTTVPPPNAAGSGVSQAAVAARIDEYFAVGAGGDVALFAAQWAYPIDDYYGVANATRADVTQKAIDYWSRYPSRTFTRVGAPEVVTGDVVRATAQMHFVLTAESGKVHCGTNTLVFVFDPVDGLPIRSIAETKGPSGC